MQRSAILLGRLITRRLRRCISQLSYGKLTLIRSGRTRLAGLDAPDFSYLQRQALSNMSSPAKRSVSKKFIASSDEDEDAGGGSSSYSESGKGKATKVGAAYRTLSRVSCVGKPLYNSRATLLRPCILLWTSPGPPAVAICMSSRDVSDKSTG